MTIATTGEIISIPTFLKSCVDLMRKGNRWRQPPRGLYYFGPMDFILRHGRHWKPAPFPFGKYRLGFDKECFRNAATLAFEHAELTYCEGYASSLLPVAHAWCIDTDGRVVDNTWTDDRAGTEYFGVPFKIAWVREQVYRHERYGLIEAYERRFPLLRIPPKRRDEFLDAGAYRLPKPKKAT